MSTSTTDLLLPAPTRTRKTLTPHRLCLDELSTLVRFVAEDPRLWQHRLRLPRPGEGRYWTRLSSSGHVEVWLLSWLPGQGTDLHDHGGSAAAFAVVRGQLAEVRLDRAGRRTTFTRAPGSVTWLAPGVVHDVSGRGTEPAVSIHAYSPPLQQMTFYTPDRAAQELRILRTVQTDEPEQEGRP